MTAADPPSGVPTKAQTAIPPEDRPEWAHLPAPARRALAEAEARRAAAPPLDLPPELGGRTGPEPVRYGDYERRGIAVDF